MKGEEEMKAWLVASNTVVTAVVLARDAKSAENKARKLWKREGYDFDQDFTAYELTEYLKDEPNSGILFC